MKTSNFAVVMLAVAIASLPAFAGSHRKTGRTAEHAASRMQTVAANAMSGQPGEGWQYFSNVREGRAVVISPKGEYFYSQGKGLALVFKATGAA